MQSIVLVVGTRPEAIKLAPVYRALQRSMVLRPILLSTGQHREMLRQTFAAFGIEPDHDLDLMTPGQSLVELNAKALRAVSQFLQEQPPAALLVQGDTTTVLASAMAAFYQRVPIGHVEAGLRTFNMQSPWPEEMNRRLASPLCRWHFAPTSLSAENLRRENIAAEHITITGNTVIDALLWVREKLRLAPPDINALSARLAISASFSAHYLQSAGLAQRRRWILVTGHRRESFGEGFERICSALIRLANEHPDVGILYPVHLNPQVREPVQRLLGQHPQIALAEPANYEDFIWLMDQCYLVLSDSGGVQEEAPSLGKPVLVMRDATERPEGIAAGTSELVGTSPDRICQQAAALLQDQALYQRRRQLANPYGDGSAAERIRQVLERDLS